MPDRPAITAFSRISPSFFIPPNLIGLNINKLRIEFHARTNSREELKWRMKTHTEKHCRRQQASITSRTLTSKTFAAFHSPLKLSSDIMWCRFLGFCFIFSIGLGYEYTTKTFTVPVDHFSFATNETFEIRYLINDSYWDRDKGPIFFYTGNEGDIEMFANNTGFMWEIAPTFKALVLFAEHRYYGKSLPFGNQSFSDPRHLGYLTSQQALADYVDLITFLKRNGTKTYNNPVIAFGGSYGGMLAAYIRMKYPHIVTGALAASAPIWQFTGMTPCDAYARIVTSDFSSESKSCSDSIRKSWAVINNVTSKEDGLKWLSTEWKLCQPLKTQADVRTLKEWLVDVYGSIAMINYPYPTNFIARVPAYPIRELCKNLRNASAADKDLLKMLFRGISVYFNYTGTEKCLNTAQSASPSLGDMGWDYQSCTEMVMPMCSKGSTDMFEPQEWNLQQFAESCIKTWKTTPKPYLAEKIYGGKDISTATNIIFSNGLLDPWASGGVLKAPSDAIIVVLIPEGAHHLDLRGSNPADPGSVRKSRLLYQDVFRKWIKKHEEQFLL